MLTLLVAYLGTLIPFLALEGGWLVLAGPRLYKPEIGSLLADKPRVPPAVLFYAFYIAGLVWFVVLPGAERGAPYALLNGAALGLLAYGTYDLTCASTMRTWSMKVTIADMVWGALASGCSCAVGAMAVSQFG